MTTLPDTLKQAWEERDGPIVFASIDAGSKGAILFITKGGTSYQVKGSIEYDSAGAYYQDMKAWNGERPGHAAAVLCVEEVYSGAQKLA